MARVPIGVQLYSVRDDCAKDLPGTLAAVAKAGYDGVEFAGYHGRSAAELRTMLDDLGLTCCGTHIRIGTLLGDELPKTVAFNKALGNKFLIVPGLEEQYRNSRQAWAETAKLFSDIAEKLKADGMLVGYHNHSIEFAPMDGEMPWDTFFGNARPDVVMQLDVGNMMHGGGDPVSYLKKYPGRAITVHVKEFAGGNQRGTLVGEGDADWKTVFELCETTGKTEWYIVEQESYSFPPLECVAKCLANLRKMGK